MSDGEEYHDSHVGDEDSENEEVVFKPTPATSPTAPPDLISQSDLHEIIEGWKEKFRKLTEGVCAIELATEEVHAHMDIVMQNNRARNSDQASTNNRIKQIQEGLAHFIERCDPAHPTPVCPFATPCAPKMSTHITPSGVPSMYRSDFPFASPVNQTAPTEPTRAAEVTTSANVLRTRTNTETVATPSTHRLTTVVG